MRRLTQQIPQRAKEKNLVKFLLNIEDQYYFKSRTELGGLLDAPWEDQLLSRDEIQAKTIRYYSTQILQLDINQFSQAADRLLPIRKFFPYTSWVGAYLGNQPCRLNLASMYLAGDFGVPQNPEKSYQWVLKNYKEKAYDCSIPLIASIYFQHPYLIKNKANALKIVELAARKYGYNEAEKMLSMFYRKGSEDFGVDADPNLAFIWTKKVADRGDPCGLYHLGVMLIDRGLDEDGLIYIREAAEQGDGFALHYLGCR